MPYSEALLPFSGSTTQSRHASHAGAEDAKERALPQTIRYMRFLKDRGAYGATDAEAAKALGLERSSINARRKPLCDEGFVIAAGHRKGESGIINTIWVLKT